MLKKLFATLFFLAALSLQTFATDGKIDSGDTTWLIVATGLVFFMTPGLALFYGGMGRKKNVINTMMASFFIIAIISLQWVAFGYSLSFGESIKGFLGNLNFAGLIGVGNAPNPDYAATIPHSLFVMFQLMFAIIAPALISGAVAERMKFSVFIIFVLLWSTFVYDPLAHWVWGAGGWLKNLGLLDFAGGTVIHISSGVAGLVAAIMLGKRSGYKTIPMIPHNIPFSVLGAGILWFGWFGFNAGSALAANGVAISALIATNTSAAAAMVAWVVVEKLHRGKATLLGGVTGAVVGLAAVTPAAGFITPLSAVIIGMIASPLCYLFIAIIKYKFNYDDALDAFGCHGIGCIWGTLATGLFATKTVNPMGNDGLFYGNPAQMIPQLIGVAAAILLSGGVTFIIFKVISLFTKLRVNAKDEDDGLDISIHGEEAYPDFTTDQSIVY